MQSKKLAKLCSFMLIFSSMINNSAHLNQFYVKTTVKAECFACREPFWWRNCAGEEAENWIACRTGMFQCTENCSALWYRPWAANRYPSLATRLCFWSKEDHNSICTVAVMYWVGVVYRTVRTVKFESGHGFIIKRTLELFGGVLLFFFLKLILNEAFKVFDVFS